LVVILLDVAEEAMNPHQPATVPPLVVATNPPDLAAEVPPDIRPTATFSKDIDRATINPDTFRLLDQVSGELVEPLLGGVYYDEAARMAIFSPRAALKNGRRRYGAIITARVKDQAGNRLEQDEIWHFYTKA